MPISLVSVKNPETQKIIDNILEYLISRPDQHVHASTLSHCFGRANVPPAIRKLKQEGLIEIIGYNLDNQPLYRISSKALDLFHGFA